MVLMVMMVVGDDDECPPEREGREQCALCGTEGPVCPCVCVSLPLDSRLECEPCAWRALVRGVPLVSLRPLLLRLGFLCALPSFSLVQPSPRPSLIQTPMRSDRLLSWKSNTKVSLDAVDHSFRSSTPALRLSLEPDTTLD